MFFFFFNTKTNRSNLIKDTLPSLVNQSMQTCQEQLIQPRLLSFVSDHIEHVYHSIGGTHVYHPSTSYTPANSTSQESLKTENKSQSTILIKKESIPSKAQLPINKNPQIPTMIKKKIVSKEKAEPIKEEKKSRILSPVHSPNELIDISPSSISIDNERTTISLSPSPPPPIVRIAPPLSRSSNPDTPRKIKRLPENNDESSTNNIKKKKIKTENIPDEKSII